MVLACKSASQSSPLVTSSPGPLRVPGLSEIPRNFSSFSVKLVDVRCLPEAGRLALLGSVRRRYLPATSREDARNQSVHGFLPGTGAGLDVVSAEQHAKYVVVSDDPDLGVLSRYCDHHALVLASRTK